MDVIAHCANLVNEMPVNLMTYGGQHFAYVVRDVHRTYLFDHAHVPFLQGKTKIEKKTTYYSYCFESGSYKKDYG